MKQPRRIVGRLIVLFALLTALAPQSMALGPDLMGNSSFEAGAPYYAIADVAPFKIVKDPANAHSGSRSVEARLASSPTWTNFNQMVSVWSHTDYVAGVWVKGAGRCQLAVKDGKYSSILGSVNFTATATWTQVRLPFNSGDNSHVDWCIYDGVGGTAGTMYLDDASLALANENTISFDAANPKASEPKFKLIFDDEFNDSSTIDVNATGKSGYHWYPQQFYGLGTTTPSSIEIVPSYQGAKGVLAFNDCPNHFSEALHTALPAATKDHYSGTVFTGGDGVYFEARIALANLNLLTLNANDPGWWMNDIKGDTQIGLAMPAYPNHTESIESDILEYNPSWAGGSPTNPTNSFNSALIDWNDGPHKTLGNENSIIYTPVGFDYTQWHTYGELWVPGNASNGWYGYRQAYVDGQPYQAECWNSGGRPSPVWPIDPAGSYRYSVRDQDWSDLILGSSPASETGGKPTMYVDYVRVYAVSKSSMKVVRP